MENQEYIEDYLLGYLSEEDMNTFSSKIESNPDLAREVERVKEIYEGLWVLKGQKIREKSFCLG